MPHKCIKCERVFQDGDPVILSGCPDCGGNKFLYIRPEEKEVSDIVLDEEKEEVISKVEEKVEKEERIESVRIISPGQYEINLEALLTRDEIIMALREDGKYVIHLPSVFGRKRKK